MNRTESGTRAPKKGKGGRELTTVGIAKLAHARLSSFISNQAIRPVASDIVTAAVCEYLDRQEKQRPA